MEGGICVLTAREKHRVRDSRFLPLLRLQFSKMSNQPIPHPRRNNLNPRRSSSTVRKSASSSENGISNGTQTRPSSPLQSSAIGERTVKKLRLSKSLTIPDGTTVSDACRRMTSRRVVAALLTDANGLLSGIITDKDISNRVVAEGLKPQQTIVSTIMTRNPVFVPTDSSAIEALQKMVQGKFRHLPVVENGEVIALLDITKCLYDAISKMEKAAEQGSAIVAAVEGVEHQWGSTSPAPYAFIETLRKRMFKPSLSTTIPENSKVAIVSPSDTVYVATKKMRELQISSVIIATGNKPQGILTSKDVLMRVVAQNLSPELTLVEKVMTPNPECAKLETTILEALHIMHDGKFLHLPVVDKGGSITACVDVLQITHAAISMVEGSSGGVNDMANTMIQNFWESALPSEPPDNECDIHSEMSALMASECTDASNFMHRPLGLGNSFTFKFQDRKGRVHRFNCGTEHLDELVSAVMQRIGSDNVQNRPQFFYEDDEGDKVLLATDSDLIGAVSLARQGGLKVLRLHLDFSDSSKPVSSSMDLTTIQKTSGLSLQSGLLAGSAALAGIGLLTYLNRSS
ncbi:CBS domain-containing protein CBSCBSPB3-like isoform X2 [Macadamia integrifolia]|uniref:CBS domain-containing protein CBSCBSPB3-like isoform X2 n=1 Tax=Macadamia integrifolia TaxID=60698 RepID=UPI001C501E46|nr:CBS domain-containing protein CBSCBSPB3-like isoform X2 [Macadamia integrifolia]